MEESSQREEESSQVVENIVDKLLIDETQAFLSDYYLNTLFKNDTEFTKGLTTSDYDIVLSSSDAEGNEIFHSLNICNCKYDPNTTASKKVIHYEHLEKIMVNFLKWKEDKEKEYKENKEKPNLKNFPQIFMHAYPMIRRNLQFDISTITFKEIKKNSDNKNEVVDFKIDPVKPDDKDSIYFCSFKLNQKEHKFGKIQQLLEQFSNVLFTQFWDFYKKAYFIFCVEDEGLILSEYALFPDWFKKVIDEGTHEKYAKFIFYVDPPGEDPQQVMNIFKMSEFEKDYYFMVNNKNIVYRADSMLCSGDIVENSIKRKNREKNNKITEEQLKQALSDFYDFVFNIKKYKYNFFFGYQFEVCLKYITKDNNTNLILSYVNFSHLIAELKTKEYELIKRCTDVFMPDILELSEIKTLDIPIDFKENKCKVCNKKIGDNEPMYYCYKCDSKPKYCEKCVLDNFNKPENKGLKQFIDPKHLLIYFKTRDLEQFKNIELYKLGKDSFTNCKDESKLGAHSFRCNGCSVSNNYIKPRFLCLNCMPGLLQDGGFCDFCVDCVQKMNKGDEKAKEIELTGQYTLYNQETRFFYEDKTNGYHDHSKHVYLMIPLEFKEKNENSYYDF